jgi:hypothetical protein
MGKNPLLQVLPLLKPCIGQADRLAAVAAEPATAKTTSSGLLFDEKSP